MVEDGILIGNCELLADMASQATGFLTYAITVKEKYSSGYGEGLEAREEMNEKKRSDLVGEIPDFTQYDTVVLIYPLWWWTLPMPVQTFLMQTDLEGKVIYSIVSHGGSKFGSAIEDTKEFTKAKVSDYVLEIYDDDTTQAQEKLVIPF